MSNNELDEKEYWRTPVAKLKSDYNHGSIFLAAESLKIIEEFITRQMYRNRTELIQSLSKLSNALVRSKPFMALIYNYSHEIIDFIQDIPKEERNIEKIKYLSLEKINQIRKLAEENFKKITRLGARLIMDQHVVLTHSSSSHVEAILLEAKRLKRRFRIICTESRPRFEGLQLVKRLIKAGIKTMVIPDSDITRAVDEAHFVLTGTDRITENTFVNKTGTHAIAVLAKEQNKPFYIAAGSDKILLKRTYPIRFFSVNKHEITKEENDNLTVQNIYYEEIPLVYLHKVISEKSIFEKDEFVDRML
jgi:translation initiation factor 2B subunit (eIF-2B alpha/beta/delta family)